MTTTDAVRPEAPDAPPESGARSKGNLAFGAGMVAVALVGAVQQMRIVLDFARGLTNEDQTLIWYAAREWGSGRAHQPTFYGQKYGTTLEGIPTEVLRALGIPFQTGFPIVLAGLALLGWWALGAAAWKRGARIAALAAVAAPLVLSIDASVMSATYAPAAGRFAATIAVAVFVAWPRRAWSLAVLLAVGGLGVSWDAGSAVLVGPAVAYAVVAAWPRRKELALGAIGLVAPLGWQALVAWFFSSHPDYDLHPAPSFQPKWSIFDTTIDHPQRLFGTFGPELWRTAWIPIGAAVVAVVLLLATRRLRYAIAGVAAAAVVLVGMGTPKALDGLPTIYFAWSRIVILFPALVWLLWFLVGESDVLARFGAGSRYALGAVAAVGVVSAVISVPGLHPRLDDLRDQAVANTGYPLVAVPQLTEQCDRLRDISDRSHLTLAVFFTSDLDRNDAYGCGALLHGRVQTLFPAYDRRTWILHAESEHDRTGLILWRVDDAFCADAVSRGIVRSCRVEQDGARRPGEPGVAVVRFRAQPAIEVLRRLGLQIRPFGPGCHPRQPSTCTHEPR